METIVFALPALPGLGSGHPVLIVKRDDGLHWMTASYGGVIVGSARMREVVFSSDDDPGEDSGKVLTLLLGEVESFAASNAPPVFGTLNVAPAATDADLFMVEGSTEVRRGSDGEIVGTIPTDDEG